jgi:hypothetical protein
MIIVNFSTKEYKLGQQRLSNSLNGYKKLMLNDYVSIGSPTHKESPYEFKLNCIEGGFNHDDIVLWCDSSLWRVGDLEIIENIIKQDGYFLTEAGHYVGRWCNEHTRNYFKLTPQELKQGPGGMTMFSAGLVGFNMKSETAMKFLYDWKASAKAGCFKGSYIDHRHDQTAGSIIAQRMGLKYQRGGQHMAYIGAGYSEPEPGIIFKLQGI